MAKRRPTAGRRLTFVEKVDLRIATAVGVDRRRRAGQAISRFAEVGDQPPLLALSLAIAAGGILRRDERLARTGLRMLAAHSLTTVAKMVGKSAIDRTRPEDALRNGHYRMSEGHSKEGRLRSMPSGHSAGSTALAMAASPDYPGAAVPAAMAATSVVLSQIPAKNHYLSDVLTGAMIGVVAGGIARMLIPPYDEIRPLRSRPARS